MYDICQEFEIEIESDMEVEKLWTRFVEFQKDWLSFRTLDDMERLFGVVDTKEVIGGKRDELLREVRGLYHSLIEKGELFPDDRTDPNLQEFHIIVQKIQRAARILTEFVDERKESIRSQMSVNTWYIGMDQEVELNIGNREEIELETFFEPLYEHLFSSRKQVDKYFQEYAPKAMRFVRGDDGYLVRIHPDDDMVYKPMSSFNTHDVRILEEPKEPGDEPQMYRVSMMKLMVENFRFIPRFTRRVFKPLDHGLQEGEFNTWRGFKFKPVKTINMELVNPFLKHITQVWASGNWEHAKYILTWMATILTRPWEKTGIALLVCGKKGSGKSMISDFFIHHLVGNGLGWMAPELSQMTMDFNSHLENKVVIGVHEVGYQSVKTYSQEYNRLKSLITDSKISIHPKYELVREAQNFSNLILHSNSGLPLEGDDDRRFCVFQTSDEKVGDLEYFRKLKENLKPENADHIGSYLINIPHLMVDLEKIPQTQIREEIIESSEPAPIRFIRELREMETLPPNLIIPNLPGYVSADELYKHYDHWRYQNGEKNTSKIQFGREIATIYPSVRKYHPHTKARIRVYNIKEEISHD